MQRRLFAFALVTTLLGNVASSGAEPPAPAAQATMARAEQLEQQAKRRYDEAASTKSVPLVQRRPLLREQLLGPVHLHLEQGGSDESCSLAIDEMAPALFRMAVKGIAVARCLNRGKFATAEQPYLRSVDIQDTLGLWPPYVAPRLQGLAAHYQAQGKYDKAEPLFVRLAELREAQLLEELSPLSEPRKRPLMQMLHSETEHAVSFHAHDAPERSLALEVALTRVLRSKGRVLDSLVDSQIALRASLTPSERRQLDQLTEARSQLTTWLYDRKRPADSNELAALRTRIDELETSLSETSWSFSILTKPVVTVAKVQAALPPGAALVELVRYRRFDAREISQWWKEERYLAYVLRPSGPPQWFALGEAAPIDGSVDAVLAAMRPNTDPAEARAALQRLHAQVLAPLAGSLQGATHLLIAPDGQLNLVPFEALIDASGDYVLQHHLVSYLTSGRDLLRFAARRPPSSGVTIVAAPNYGPGAPFVALPGAMAEGWELRRAFPRGKLLTGRAASKRAFSRLTSPAVLHVATHGFYARGTKAASAPLAARGMFIETSAPALLPPPPPRSSRGDELDALDRAGLALADANVNPRGIITAREIAGLNWSGTQLVVLSACETGVGEVATGEGVYGLRRALVLSGAQAQVVSLWNVADTATLALMKAFYAELARGTGRAEALRRAKLALLQEPRFAHPYYWAAFFAAGDWRPLDKRLFATARPKP